MIRTDSKVLGEANDPNTVIATDTLTEGKLIIGAGNKGIKTVDLGTNKLLHTNGEAKLTGFDFHTPNKYVCTDDAGNLVLKDKLVIIPISISRAELSDSSGYVDSLNIYTPNSMSGLSEKLSDWLYETGDTSLIEIVKSTESTQKALNLYLSIEPTILTETNCRIILTLEAETLSSDKQIAQKPILWRSIKLSNLDKSVNNDILDIGDNPIDFDECVQHYIALNRVISIASGSYPILSTTVTIPAALDTTDNKCYIKVSGCIILGV